MRVFITGGTGLVGSRLIAELKTRGDQAVVLTRRPDAAKHLGVEVVAGDPSQAGDWMRSVQSCDAVVNLVGEGIFNRRWNADFKEVMRKSRVDSTRNISQAIADAPRKADGSPKVLVSASAIGIYGPHGDEPVTEREAASADFLGKLCVEWEGATALAKEKGVRVVILRVGVVLDPKGGALQKMLPPFKMFVGGPIGSGRQYVSWIHHSDMVGLILFALDRASLEGPVNATAPNPVTNREFSKAIGSALGRPSFLPTPGFALYLGLGEVAGVITQGQRVLPQSAEKAGYPFRFPQIQPALSDLLKT